MLTFYGYKNCDSCRKAEKYLTAKGVAYEFVDITQTPPSATLLKSVVERSELEWKKLFNVSGELYRSMSIKDKLPSMKADEAYKLLASHGKLIKRPFITDGKTASIGFKGELPW